MKLRKKALAGFVATSLAVTSLAGVTISANGVSVNLGVNVASAADANLQKLVELQAKFYNAVSGNSSVNALKDTLATYDHSTAVDPLYTEFDSHGLTLTDGEKTALVTLLSAIALPVTSIDTVATLLQDPDVASLVDKLEANVGGGFNLTVEDVAALFVGLNDKAYSVILSGNDFTSNRRATVEAIVEDVLGDGTSVASQLITHYFDSNANFKAAVLASFDNYMSDATLKGEFNTALPFLVAAFVSANAPAFVNPGSGTIVTSDAVSEALKTLAELKAKLATATEAEKAALIKQANNVASAAIASATAIDASKLVTTDGDTTSVKVDTAAIANLLKDLATVKKALEEAVGSSAGLTLPVLKINIGNVEQSVIKTSIPADAATQLKAAGIKEAIVGVNGAEATLSLDRDVSNGIEAIVGNEAYPLNTIAVGPATIAPGGSGTFSFNGFNSGESVSVSLSGENGTGASLGQANSVVGSKLVDAGDEWKSSLAATSKLDPELLTIAKVEADGSLSIQGGIVKDGKVSSTLKQGDTYLVVENKVTFNDIGSVQSWAGRQIQVVASSGAIQGKANGQFAPTDSVTRAEFAKMLVLALDIDNDSAVTSQFTDVNSAAWYAPYVAVAAEEGIINGRTATTFAPNATISRAEMSTMIARALKSVKGIEGEANVEEALAGFSDAGQISASLKEGVALAASKNIVIGSNGKFNPNNNATRAEAAVILYRTLNTK